MNHVQGFFEEFQGRHTIDLDDYRLKKKTGSRKVTKAQAQARSPTVPHIVTLTQKALGFQQSLEEGEVKDRAAELDATCHGEPGGTMEGSLSRRSIRRSRGSGSSRR